MRSELAIVELVKAGVSGNQDAVRVTAEAIAAEDARRNTLASLIVLPKRFLLRLSRRSWPPRPGSPRVE